MLKIKRVIHGEEVEIELTGNELFEAYIMQENIWDRDNCALYLDTEYSDEEWYENLNSETREELIEEAADQYRRNIDKYEMNHDYAMSEAFSEVLSSFFS